MTEPREEATPTAREWLRRGLTLTRRAVRFWPALAGAAIIAAAAALLTPRFMPPIFESKTVLVYRELLQTPTLLGTQDIPAESQRQRGTRLREMMLSRTNLEKIIVDHKLYADTVEARGMIEAVEEFRRVADCKVGEDTFYIKYEAEDPDIVHKVTERLAQSLVEQSAAYRLEQAESTKSFLEAQEQKTKKELDDKEQSLAEFLAVHPEFAQDVLMGGGSAAGASIRAQERKNAGVDPAIQALNRQRQRLAGRLKAADGGPGVEPGPDMDPEMAAALERAKEEVEQARTALRSAESRYTEKHPDVVDAKRRLQAAESALGAAKEAALQPSPARALAPPATEDDKEKLSSQLASVEENLARARQLQQKGDDSAAAKSSNWIVDLETRWAGLNRDVMEVRERYQQIQRRLFQAAIIAKVEASGGATQMVVVDPAFRPERPARRGSRRVGAAAALIVMLIGGVIALVLAYTDERIYDEEDVRRMAIAELIHTVPAAKGARRSDG
jgi:uncharacterized protein involved in exopolysaccharide biosynthesis